MSQALKFRITRTAVLLCEVTNEGPTENSCGSRFAGRGPASFQHGAPGLPDRGGGLQRDMPQWKGL